jgi:hypothetical protein
VWKRTRRGLEGARLAGGWVWRWRGFQSGSRGGAETRKGRISLLMMPAVGSGKGAEGFHCDKTRDGEASVSMQTARDEEGFLSTQADTFAGANVKEEESACFVRNDGVAGWVRESEGGFHRKTRDGGAVLASLEMTAKGAAQCQRRRGISLYASRHVRRSEREGKRVGLLRSK